MDYQEIFDRRRALIIEPFKSLAEVGFDGPWVTPYQISSKSSEGPVLVALHWLDEPSILRERTTLQNLGYLPNIRFNTVIDAALARQGLSRSYPVDSHPQHRQVPLLKFSKPGIFAEVNCRRLSQSIEQFSDNW